MNEESEQVTRDGHPGPSNRPDEHVVGETDSMGCGRRTGDSIPQRENPDRRPTDRARAVAARVRVNADRRIGKRTPQWIIDLARKSRD